MERAFHMLLYRAFHAQRSYLRPSLKEIGLGSGQPKLLAYLWQYGPCSQKQLADYFELDPAGICRMLDSLERNGFIVRDAVQGDRRTGLIRLTDRGRRAQERWRERCREMEDLLLEGFTPQEQAAFADYLSRAYHNLRAGRKGGGSAV